MIAAQAYQFFYAPHENRVTLNNGQGGRLFTFPAGGRLKLDGRECFLRQPRALWGENTLTLTYEEPDPLLNRAQVVYTFGDDEIVISLTAEAAEDFAVEEAELFRDGRYGLYMVDCINYFAPVPRNYNGINRAFRRSIPDCSCDGYFTPPPLNFSIGNRSGWVSFGLLDLPNSYEYKMTGSLGILVEKPCGRITTPAGGTYRAPRLMLTFPQEEWQGVSLFRQKLLDKGLMTAVAPETFPDWWKRPFVVTYGDQMLELQYNWYSDLDWNAPGYTQQWLQMWLDRAEERLGCTDFTIMVDAFWQHRYSADGRADTERFPAMRAFIDECHRRGHKVLLWSAALIEDPRLAVETTAKKFNMLSDKPYPGGLSYFHNLDFTSDWAEDYFNELSRLYFSADADALDCDGLKLDFLACLQNPEFTEYRKSGNGIGVREMYRFYELFDRAARKVKPDVLLNGSACEPRFEQVLHVNRLHDIQNVYEERELRARCSVLAAPGMIVDSDGAIMLSPWVEDTYLSAVLYGTPSLYYVERFHDNVRLEDEKMRALGRLLQLSGQKPWGQAEYLSPGSWRLTRDGQVLGATFDGRTLLLFCDDGKARLFSWQTGVQTLPLFGHTVTGLPEGWTAEGDVLRAETVSGQVYAFPFEN